LRKDFRTKRFVKKAEELSSESETGDREKIFLKLIFVEKILFDKVSTRDGSIDFFLLSGNNVHRQLNIERKIFLNKTFSHSSLVSAKEHSQK